jgi:proteasome lid subunit RPN8/RPN11
VIRLGSQALAAIRRHAADAYPNECCGALIGPPDGEIVEAFALPNTTEEGPRRRFLVRPGDYRSAEARAAASGAELRGFYHSHPDHPARPSQYDLDHAWPNLSYLIVSVRQGQPGEIRCWRLQPDRTGFVEEKIERNAASRRP